MIISKYVTNSLDIHYVLAKASELQAEQNKFYDFITKFLDEKGKILTEFEDLGNERENIFEEKINESRKFY